MKYVRNLAGAFLLMLACMQSAHAAATADPNTAYDVYGNPYNCKNYEKECKQCDSSGNCTTFWVDMNGNCPAESSDTGGRRTKTSIIDNLKFNHIHFAWDWHNEGPTSQSGCKTCGGSSFQDQGVPALELQRRHRFRDMTQQSSFGPGVFQSYDITLNLTQNGAANRIIAFNPAHFNPQYFDDGLNFRGNGDMLDGVYVDSLNNTIRNLRLTNGPSGTGSLVTNIYQAKGADMLCYGGRHFLFDVIDLGGQQGSPLSGTTVWQHADIGTVAAPGSASYGRAEDFTIQGSGADVWGTSDSFRYVYQNITGDFTLITRVASIDNTDPWAKAGLMVRQSTSPTSINAAMIASSANGYGFQTRTAAGAASNFFPGGGTNYPNSWIKLVRTGSIISGYRGAGPQDSVSWIQVGAVQLATTDPVLVGMCVTAHHDGLLCTAQLRSVALTSNSQPQPWQSADIGTSTAGTTTDLGTQNTFTINSSGSDVWDQHDSGHFVYQALRGDGSITVRVNSLSQTDSWAKAGVIFRESLADNSKFAYTLLSAGNGLAFQRRTTTGGWAVNTGGPAGMAPQWVRMVRAGNIITASCSSNGNTWVQVGSDTVAMNNDVYVGLISTAHHNGALSISTFDNLTLTGTPTPAGQWPPTQVGDFLGGRLTGIVDRNGYGVSLKYQYNPAWLPNTSATQQAAIAISPDYQWQIDTITDAQGRQLKFAYNAAQVSGRWVVSQITLPNAQNIQYAYANGRLSQVTHPDGTISTFSVAPDATGQFTVVTYNDGAADVGHGNKSVYLTNNFVERLDGFVDNVPSVYSSASLLVRMVTDANNEVTYLNISDPNSPYHWKIYEGSGKARELSNGRTNRYFKDGWTFTPGHGYNTISGTPEDTFVDEQSMGSGDNYYLGYVRSRPATVVDENGVTRSYLYNESDKVSQIGYPDSTTEQWQYNQFQEIIRYQDRLGRVARYTYDTHGNLTLKEVGILNVGGVDTNQPEYAQYKFDYYPAGDPNQFLLKTAYDADFNPANPDLHRTDYAYDNNHFLLTKTEGADATGGQRGQWTFTYDSAGRMATSTDQMGRTARYDYDARDRVVRITYADGSTERMIYGAPGTSDSNLLIKKKDRNGVVTQFVYDNSSRCIDTITAYSTMDQADNETLIADPLVRVEEICTYLNGTDVKASCLKAGDLTEYVYDYRHRALSTTVHPRTGTALTTTNTYVNNLLFSVQDPYGRKSYNAYRSSDSALVRTVNGTVPGFSLANFAAVTAQTRDLTNNAAFIVTDVTLDAMQQMTAKIDGRNIQSTFNYDSRGRLTQTIEAQSVNSVATTVAATTQYQYDAQSNRTLVINPRTFSEASDFKTQFTYTGRNLLASKTEALGKPEAATESYTYYLDQHPKDRTDARGNVWTKVWKQCCGRLGVEADPLLSDGTRPVTLYEYDFYGSPTHVTRLRNINPFPTCCLADPPDADTINETTTKYDAQHRPIAQTVWLTPLGAVDENNPPIFGDAGAPAGKTGLTTRWRYDDNLTDGVGIDADYSAQLAGLNLGLNNDGYAVETTNPAGEKSVAVYDGAMRLIRTIDGNKNLVTTTYDAVVNALLEASVTDGLNHVTKSRADGVGRVRETVDAETNLSTHAYDANSNRVSFRDPNSVGADLVFDERNRETQRTDTANPPSVTKKAYDTDNNLVKTTDALAHDTNCTFDARDRKISCLDRIAGTTSYTYDPNNNLLTITDADSNQVGGLTKTNYAYDPRNLLVNETFPDHNPPAVSDARSYTYDGANRLTSRVDQSNVTTAYVYDMANRLTSRTYPDSLNDTFGYDGASRLTSAACGRYNNTVTRDYTAGGELGGRLKAETQNIGGVNYVVGYGYDAANRQTNVTYPSGDAVVRTFTNRNQLLLVGFNGNAVAQRVYDPGMRLTSTTYGNNLVENRTYFPDNLNNTIKIPGVTDFTYSWDANKRKTAEADAIVPPVNSQTFGYDNEDRLTSFNRQNGDSQAWNLSLVGDWNTFNSNANLQTRTHNSVHELNTINAVSLSYDSKGNLTQNVNSQTYAWDVENRMSQATIPAVPTPQIAGYAYDALGRRVSKTFNGVTTAYVNDGLQEIAEYNNAVLGNEYVFGAYIDEPMLMVNAGVKTYYHANNLYSVAALTNAAGAVVERMIYDPYGNVKILAPDGVTVRTTSSVGNLWTFTGRRLDGETGLMYYRTRTYDMNLGRFLNRMPWEAIGGRISLISFSPLLEIFHEGNWRRFMIKVLRKSEGSYIQRRYDLYDFERNNPLANLEPFSALPVPEGDPEPFDPTPVPQPWNTPGGRPKPIGPYTPGDPNVDPPVPITPEPPWVYDFYDDQTDHPYTFPGDPNPEPEPQPEPQIRNQWPCEKDNKKLTCDSPEFSFYLKCEDLANTGYNPGKLSDIMNRIRRRYGKGINKGRTAGATGGPCVGRGGTHIAIKKNGDHLNSIGHCPCCLQSPTGPKLQNWYRWPLP